MKNNISRSSTLQRHNTENSKQMFPEKELRGLSPNSYIHVFYSSAGKYVDRSREYINRSQTHECGNWDWGRAVPLLGNRSIEISLQCRKSAGRAGEQAETERERRAKHRRQSWQRQRTGKVGGQTSIESRLETEPRQERRKAGSESRQSRKQAKTETGQVQQTLHEGTDRKKREWKERRKNILQAESESERNRELVGTESTAHRRPESSNNWRRAAKTEQRTERQQPGPESRQRHAERRNRYQAETGSKKEQKADRDRKLKETENAGNR
jgi:hypothetical protein